MAGELELMLLGAIGAIGLLLYYFVETRVVGMPYFKCRNKPDRTLMLLFQKNGVLRLLTSNYIAQTYEYESPTELLAFAKTNEGSFIVGKDIADCFYDGADMAQTPELWLAFEALMKMGYKNLEEVLAAIKTGKLRGSNPFELGGSSEIGVKFKGEFEIVGLPSGKDNEVYIPLFKQVNPHVVSNFCQGVATIYKGYADTKVNIERMNKLGGVLSSPNAKMLIIIGIFIFIVLVGLKAVGII